MSASYPDTVKSWVNVADNTDDVVASHMNDIYEEVIAIETDLEDRLPDIESKLDALLLNVLKLRLDSVASAGDIQPLTNAWYEPLDDDSNIESGNEFFVTDKITTTILDANLKLLMHMENNATDEKGNTVTNTNVTFSDSIYQVGSYSAYFNNSNSYLTIPATSQWANFGTGDFTIRCKLYFNSVSKGYQFIIDQRQSKGLAQDGWMLYTETNNKLNFGCAPSGAWTIRLEWATVPTISTWYEVEVVRSGTSFKMRVDGTEVASGTSSTAASGTNTATIDIGSQDGGARFSGYMDELAVWKFAMHTANYTPNNDPINIGELEGEGTVVWDTVVSDDVLAKIIIVSTQIITSGTLVWSASRDNGTTWTVCALDTVVDISAQPSGSNIKIKAALDGQIEINKLVFGGSI